MKIGFTGTRKGMTARQFYWLWHVLTRVPMLSSDPLMEVHHGGCVGSDDEFHFLMAERFGSVRIVLHPPVDKRQQADCPSDEVREPKPFLERDHNIVDETNPLIATPKGMTEELRSGTWATIRYARKQGKQVIIIYPDGSIGE